MSSQDALECLDLLGSKMRRFKLMLSALNIILFLSYTLASVGSMLIIKAWLPAVETQWAMKATLWGAPLIWAVFGLLLYGGSFAIWIAILARNELTVAYPLAIGLT